MNVIPYFQLFVIFSPFPKPHTIPWRCNLSVFSCPSSVINQCFMDFPVNFRTLSKHSLTAFVAISLLSFNLNFVSVACIIYHRLLVSGNRHSVLACFLLTFLPPIVFAFASCTHSSPHMLPLHNVAFRQDKQAVPHHSFLLVGTAYLV